MTSIFNRIPSEAYDAASDHMVKAHMIKVCDNSGMAKICDVVDLRLAAGDDWHTIINENLTIEGIDGIIEDFKSLYWILNNLRRAGSSWNEIKESLYNAEEAWI